MIELISPANQYQKEYQALSSDLPLPSGVASGKYYSFSYPAATGIRTDIIDTGATCFIADTFGVYVFHDGAWYNGKEG